MTKTMQKDSYMVCGYDIRAFLAEYDEVLIGKKKTYSAALMSKQHGTELCAALLKLIFAEYLNWTPYQIRDCLTLEIIKRMCLAPLINKIPCPQEVLRDKELYFVAGYLYPYTVKRDPHDPRLVIKIYHDLLNGNIQKFPKEFFAASEEGRLRARILFRVMVKEFLSGYFGSYADMYHFFASSQGMRTIEKYKLKRAMQTWFSSPLEYLHESLRVSERTPELDALYESLCEDKENGKRVRGYKGPVTELPETTENLDEQPDLFDEETEE